MNKSISFPFGANVMNAAAKKKTAGPGKKQCPECNEIIGARSGECPKCGHKFTPKAGGGRGGKKGGFREIQAVVDKAKEFGGIAKFKAKLDELEDFQRSVGDTSQARAVLAQIEEFKALK